MMSELPDELAGTDTLPRDFFASWEIELCQPPVPSQQYQDQQPGQHIHVQSLGLVPMPPIRHLPVSPQIRVRQRSRRACAPCRKRKIKCDGTEPCAACLGYGYDCIYPESRSPAKSKEPEMKQPPSELKAPPLPTSDVSPLYIASETPLPDGNILHHQLKTRFTTSCSAIAFPKLLGTSLGLSTPPRLQSFGWNPGTRPETAFPPPQHIVNIISLDEMREFTDIYFKEIHPYFGIFDQELFMRQAESVWAIGNRGYDFEALVCGVVALGSYFSTNPCTSEVQVVELGRLLLDFSIAHPPALLSIKNVMAWILRAIYLRSTTRPHLSWMASSAAVHLSEAIGLHRELKGRTKCERERIFVCPPAAEEKSRKRTFWMAMALNKFLSAEYGRTKTGIGQIECKPLEPGEDFTYQTVSIMLSVPDGSEDLEMNKVTALPSDAPFLGLLRADVCFSTFRMIRSVNLSVSSTQIGPLLEVIRVALDGVKFLQSMKQPWWNIVGSPFHCVCVLLSIGSSESLSMLPRALETLKNIATEYDSHLSGEALSTAYELVRGARAKKSKELESLDRGLEIIGNMSQSNGSSDDFEWLGELGLNDFLDFGNFPEGNFTFGDSF